MPVTDGIIVPITADAKGLTDGMDKAKKSVGQFAAASTATAKAVNVMSDSLDNGAKSVSNFENASSKITKSSGAAVIALSNVGRVAQDLPFGFLGIQNNLNPLLESFQRLKAETGSNGAAFKALSNSLIGAGGVGLALSLASSAFLLFGDRLFDSKTKTAEAASEIDGYRRSLMAANNEAAKSIATVANLVAADSLQIASLEQKKKIVDDLKSFSTAYFGELRIEKGEIVGLAQAYQLYADNIFRVAQAKVAAKEIERLGAKLAEVTKLSNDLKNSFEQSGGKQLFIGGADRIKELEKLTGGTYFENIQNIQRIIQLTGKTEQQVLDYLGKKNKLRTEELQLTGQIYSFAQKTATLPPPSPTKDLKQKAEKELIEPNTKFQPEKLKGRFLGGAYDRVQMQTVLQYLNAINFATKQVGQTITEESNREANAMLKAQSAALAWRDTLYSIGDVIVPQLQSSFSTMFETLITGGSNAFGSLMQSLGRLVTKLISAAIAAAALAAILASTGLGAGLGFKGGFKDVFKSLFSGATGLKLASGGITNGPTRALIGEGKEREVVTPLSQLKNIIGNVGGSRDMPVPQLYMRGADMWIMWQRQQQQNLRSY